MCVEELTGSLPDFCKALRDHAEFVAGLREHVYGAGSVDGTSAPQDALCPLSRWLAGVAPPYQRLPEYEALRLAHALFHVRAATVVSLVKVGRRTEAEAQFACGGALRRRSAALVRTIAAFRHKIKGAVGAPGPDTSPLSLR